jgi:tetratricopeptide (TPR) repeat protein
MKNAIHLLAALGLAAATLQAQVPGFPKQPSAAGLGEAPPAAPAQEELDALKKLQDVNDPAKLMQAVDEFAIRFPKSSLLGAAYTTAGQAAQQSNNSIRVKYYYGKAIAADPGADFAMIMLAAEIANTTPDGAQNQAEELAKAEKLANDGMMLVDKRQQAPGQSKEEFETMRSDDLASGHMALGLIYMGRKQWQPAAEEFMLSVNVGKNSNPANLIRAGMCLINAGQFDQATSALDRFLKIPNLPPDYQRIANDLKSQAKSLKEGKKP